MKVPRPSMLPAVVLALGLLPALPAAAGTITPTVGGTVCITSDPFGPDPTVALFRPVPIGCDLTNGGVPFSFIDVPDASGVLHDVTINDLVFYQLAGTEDSSVFINGSVSGVGAFTATGTSGGNDAALFDTPQGLGIDMVAKLPGMEITWGDPSFYLTLAPGTLGIFEQRVDDNLDGTYTVATKATLLLAATLDGGLTFVPEDPVFALETFEPGTYPELDRLLSPTAVPEPGTLVLFGLGLVGIVTGQRRRAARRRVS
ncbi:MAG: PEP-CTERM sorting domain-containing protein [Vicinamibacterales bacterium]